MNDEKEIELLPCPFCGESDIRWSNKIISGNDELGQYYCHKCYGRIGGELQTKEESIKLWNTRKHPFCNHVELDEDKVKNYLYAMGDGIYTMDNAKDVAHNICKQFSQPK